MRWRSVAVFSLGINVALAAVWLVGSARQANRALNAASASGPGAGGIGRTNFVLRRQFFSWQEVESPDFLTYVANLRSIGCPEQTIRDIIIADVNAMYSRKLATDLTTPEQQWWRSEPDTNVLQIAQEKARELDDERRTLLSRLLGPNWESGDMISLPRPSRPGVVLDGPVLGSLTPETKQAIQEISVRSEAHLQSYVEEQRQQGKNPDPAELARLRKQTRDDLARVLPPAQLEEFLLRYSQYAGDLRSQFGQLKYFNATADEFRAIFRNTDDLDYRIQLLADSTDPNAPTARQQLEAQRENAIKTALGAARYEEYQLLHDPLYRDAVATADESGTPEAARALYQINLAASSTQEEIQANTNLTAAQRAIEMKQLEADQLRANALATGQQLPPDATAQQPPPRRTYTLQAGDTPAVIGMIYGVPVSAIRAANPNVDFNRLRPGDAINIPPNALRPTTSPAVPGGQ